MKVVPCLRRLAGFFPRPDWCSLPGVGFFVFTARFVAAVVSLGGMAATVAAQPVVSNLAVSQPAGTRTVAIAYLLSHPQSLPCTVTMQGSRDNGATWETVTATSGALGAGITSTTLGAVKLATWNAGSDWPAQLFPQAKIRITADDGQGGGAAAAGFALLPAGTFTMGDSLDGMADAPAHAVTLAAFSLAKTETTKAEWDEVRAWAATHGYTDLSTGAGKALP